MAQPSIINSIFLICLLSITPDLKTEYFCSVLIQKIFHSKRRLMCFSCGWRASKTPTNAAVSSTSSDQRRRESASNVLIKIKGISVARSDEWRASWRDAADYYLPWMDDWWVILSPLTITQMREQRFPAHPTEARDSDVRAAAEQRDSRSIWSKRLHFVLSPCDRCAENKVLSLSESSLNDIAVM